MFDSSDIVVGLEVGTSKVCAVVGEFNPAGALTIIGVGQCRSRGVRKGEITDPALAEEDIRNAIVEAEQMADAEIRSVYLGVTGHHIRGFNNRGVQPVVSADRVISEEDVQDAIKNAKAINLPADHHVIHAIRQHFMVDGHDGIHHPVGMHGGRLEVDMHVIHGHVNRLKNAIAAVNTLQIEVETVAFTGLASSLALLGHEEKELGALVIDLGGGTTEYLAYANGSVKLSGVLAVGGDHVSNDLAYGLKVPLSRAEQLKIEHGAALVNPAIRGQTVALTSDLGFPEKNINLEHLRQIMSLRLQEIFEIIHQELAQADLLDYLRAGVVLCGGGARTPQIDTLAADVLELPATLGKTIAVSGDKASLNQPEFAAGIGLARFGSMQVKRRKDRGSLARGIKETITQIFRRS